MPESKIAENASPRKKPRSKLQKAISRYSGYALLVALHAIVSRFPLWLGRALAKAAGLFAYAIVPSSRELALQNLRAAFSGQRSEREIRAIARAAFQNAAVSMVEWAILRRWMPEKLFRKFPEICRTLDRIEADLRSSGSGAVGLTGHIGNWEVLSLFFGRYKPGLLVAVANRVYFHKYQEFFHRMRTGSGYEVVYSDESPRRILRAIQNGAIGGFLPDADVRTNSGIFVEFFGRPTYTVAFPVQLARKFDVPYFFLALLREGSKFRVEYSGLRSVPRTGDADRDVAAATQDWTRLLEETIRRDPAQWAWMQPRWRSTPGSPRRRAGHSGRRAVRGERPARAVFFDVGQTLLRVRSSVGKVYAAAARKRGIDADPDALDRRFRSAWARSVERSRERGHRTSEEILRSEWFRIVSETMPEGLSEGTLREIFEDLCETFSSQEAWDLAPRALETLEALKRLGVRTGVLSNWDGRLPKLLLALGLRDRLDCVVVSYEVGFEKPHPAIFEEALRRAGTLPEETVHVGDSWALDVEPALRLGMRAVLFSGRAERDDPRVLALESFPEDPLEFWGKITKSAC